VAIGLITLCLFSLWHFPIAQFQLLIGLILYAALLYFKPLSWLIILPLLTVGLSLTPWSGRFLNNEHDLFVLLTIAMGLLQTRKIINSSTIGLLPIVFTVFSLISLSSISVLELFEPIRQNPYFSSAYPFAVAKGVGYALGLAWILKKKIQQDPSTAILYIVIGGILTSFLLFSIALWERKTIGYLFDATPWIQVLHSFLNFSGAYRMTGIMSDMHTGGESLDGMFLILAPLNLLGVYLFKTHQGKAFALAGLLCLIYCVMVGFTRATYVSVSLSIGAFAALQYLWRFKTQKADIGPLPLIPLLLYAVYAISVWFAYAQAGYYSIVAGGIALIGIFVTHYFKDKLKIGYWLILVLINLLVMYICIDSFYDSQWVDQSQNNLVSLIVATLFMLSSALLVNLVKSPGTSSSLYPHIAAILIAAVLAVALGGARIQMRMDTTTRDLDTRFTHWQSVVDSSTWTLKDILLGNGWGSFPTNYVTSEPELVRRIGSFTVLDDGFENTLLLGAGEDLAFGQRLNLNPNTNYTANILLKSSSTAKITTLHLSLCERNLIIFERWAVNCETKRIPIKASPDLQLITSELNTNNIAGNIGIKRLPTVFLLRYNKGAEPLEIKSIELLDQNSESIITNSHFSQGTDHWFFYHDFEHLPWHIKNIYLSIFYQLGMVGTLLFLTLLVFSVKNLLNSSNETQLLHSSIASIILGYLAFGVFGDPLDSARVSSLFFMLLFYLASSSKIKRLP
jgi:hypothetical protein